MPKNKAAMESELSRLEMEEELARLEAEEAAEAAKSGPGLPETIETAGRSVLEGATAGISEPAISGVNAVLGNLIESGFDAESLKDFFSKSIDTARISKEYERDVSRRQELEKQLSGIAMTGEIAGAMAPGGIPARIGKAVAGAVKGAAAIPAVAPIVKGALEAGASAIGTEAVKQAAQIPTGVMPPEEQLNVLDVGEMGAKIGAGIGAIPVAGKAIAAAAPKVLSAFGGVKPQAIIDYLKRSSPLEPLSLDDLKARTDEVISTVQNSLKSIRTRTADDLQVGVEALKQKVVDQADEALQILEQEGARQTGKKAKLLNYKKIDQEIDSQIAKQRIGEVAPSPRRQAVIEALQDLKERYAAVAEAGKGKLTLLDGKELIRSLDEMTDWARGAGQFDSRMDQALKGIRKQINLQLREISPSYAKKMDDVASDAKLLGQVSDMFTNDDKAYRAVRGLVLGNNPSVQNAVGALEASTGIKINKSLEALRRMEPIERLAPTTTENFLKSVMSGRSIENKKTLQLLSQLGDEDLMVLADRAALTQEFGKLVMNGSRDVNFWTAVLGAAGTTGAAGGIIGGPAGVATGAAIGYLVKTYGASTTKRILDGVIKVRGIPTVEKMNKALSSVNPEVKQSLLNGFIRANVLNLEPGEPTTVNLDPEQIPEVYADVQQSNLSSVDKARALESITKKGSIDTALMRKVMGSMEPMKAQPKKQPSKRTLEADKPDALRRR
jgi:hypothetical protein